MAVDSFLNLSAQTDFYNGVFVFSELFVALLPPLNISLIQTDVCLAPVNYISTSALT